MSEGNENVKDVFICKNTIKRLLVDVKETIKNPLDDQGIFYKHSDSDMMEGYAYIVGPPDSLYSGGNYFFKFRFPTDYPFSPPKLTYMTNNGCVRFHPNFYKSGKVCLSILNTWRGEQWSSCQTIKSILLTLVSIMDNKPLLHEPGINELHRDFNNYTKIIEYYNLEFSINTCLNPNMLKESYINIWNFYELFEQEIKENASARKIEILNKCKEKENEPFEIVKTGLYSLECKINYKKLYSEMKKTLKSF